MCVHEKLCFHLFVYVCVYLCTSEKTRKWVREPEKERDWETGKEGLEGVSVVVVVLIQFSPN